MDQPGRKTLNRQHLVSLGCLVFLVDVVIQPHAPDNQTNQTNQMNQTNQTNEKANHPQQLRVTSVSAIRSFPPLSPRYSALSVPGIVLERVSLMQVFSVRPGGACCESCPVEGTRQSQALQEIRKYENMAGERGRVYRERRSYSIETGRATSRYWNGWTHCRQRFRTSAWSRLSACANSVMNCGDPKPISCGMASTNCVSGGRG